MGVGYPELRIVCTDAGVGCLGLPGASDPGCPQSSGLQFMDCNVWIVSCAICVFN